MGFIQRKCYVIGGDEDFPIGNTYEYRLLRSQTLLTKIVNTIISTNTGWELDTAKNATATSYAEIPDISGTKPFPGLFLRNSISGCKLFAAYFGESPIDYGIKDFSGNDLISFNGSKYHGGLCMSMIPDSSDSEFGDPNTATFIPADATRVTGSVFYSISSPYLPKYSYAYSPNNGWSYTYILLVTPYCISVFSTHDEHGRNGSLALPTYACGRIFGALSHESTTSNAKYGTICMSYALSGSEYEGRVYVHSTSSSAIGGEPMSIPWYGQAFSTNPLYGNGMTCGAIAKANGEWVNGYADGHNVILYTVDPLQLTVTYSNAFESDRCRWSAIGMMSVGNGSNMADVGIIPGSGFKGYLDTDLFRACSGAFNSGASFYNNRFRVVENKIGWLLGIDSSDDDPS